jgi:N-acetylglutamate synthase-like GNAT family acetyltransferase
MKTPENFHIRPARVEDVPIILELIRDLARYERATHEVTARERTASQFELLLRERRTSRAARLSLQRVNFDDCNAGGVVHPAQDRGVAGAISRQRRDDG